MAIYGHNLHVFVGDTYHNAGNDTDKISAAATNAIFICRPDGTAYDSAANKLGGTSSDTKFKIGQKDADGNVRFSPVVDIANVLEAKAVEASTGVAHQEQVSSIGYTSAQTSGSIDLVNSNRYTLRIAFKHDDEMYSQQSDLHFFEYVSDANATQLEIVEYFAQVMSKSQDFSGKNSGKKRAKVKVERFVDAAFSDIGTNSDVTAVVLENGSKSVTMTGLQSNQAATVAVGNYIRFDASAGDADEKAVDPVYKIVAVDLANDVITLDQPYQGASVSTDMAGADCHISTVADIGTANCGLRITGLENEFALGRFEYDVVVFELTGDGFGESTIAENTAAAKCTSCARSIAELEWFGAPGSAGSFYRGTGFPNNSDLFTLFSKTTLTDLYDVVHISARLDGPRNLPISGVGDPGLIDIVIAIDNAGTTPTDMMDVLQHISGLAAADLD